MYNDGCSLGVLTQQRKHNVVSIYYAIAVLLQLKVDHINWVTSSSQVLKNIVIFEEELITNNDDISGGFL